ncbi:MAG: MBL fold metallo-hydrolase [Eubacteriales bacterium]|nr:MBL fold metallo-hydrolase [Eubacteriales bacterium]
MPIKIRKQPAGLSALLIAAALSLAPCSLSAHGAGASVYYQAGSEDSAEKKGPALALEQLAVRTDNFDEEPQFNGGEIRFLANTSTEQQQLSGVFRSSDGKVLVLDGGVAADAQHLISVIKEFGGTVNAWIITHPQDDHVGALYEILENHFGTINIENIYFHFQDYDWYGEVDPPEQEMVWNLIHAMKKLPEDRLHGFDSEAVREDTVVTLSDKLSFRVLNDPASIPGAYAVNNSSIMYDIEMDGKHIIALGDMGPDGGDAHLPNIAARQLQTDYVIMAHHGQNGVRENFYRAINPQACIWSCPEWLFNPGDDKKFLRTNETKTWINLMGITRNYSTKDGDITLR